MTHAENELLPHFIKSINEAESTKDVKKALVDSMLEICSSECSEE